MAMITRFEDIQAWQEARKLVKMIYRLTSSGMLAKDFGLRNQIQRAAVSAMTNIAEGFDCESKAEFARFLGFDRWLQTVSKEINLIPGTLGSVQFQGYSSKCHPEHREGSPEQLSQQAQLLGDSSLPVVAQNDIMLSILDTP